MPTSGRILVDGGELPDADLAWWRGHIAYVPQETVLIPGSLRDNLAWSVQRACSDDELWENALLATSEIVTHSLTQASGECRLAAWHSPQSGWLRVEVTDGGGEMPSLVNDPNHPELGGLRLAVLLEVPSAWGIETTPFGRTVWFEIHRASADGSPRPNDI